MDENQIVLTHTDVLGYLTNGPGKLKFEINDLAKRIKRDGLLDPLIVNKSGNDYLVFEGNRRLAALNLVYLDYINNNDGQVQIDLIKFVVMCIGSL